MVASANCLVVKIFVILGDFGTGQERQMSAKDKGGNGKMAKKIEEYVRSIPDFPEKGIIFRDITTVL